MKRTICKIVEETLKLTDNKQIKDNLLEIKERAECMEDRLLEYCNAVEGLGFTRIGRNYEEQ